MSKEKKQVEKNYVLRLNETSFSFTMSISSATSVTLATRNRYKVLTEHAFKDK